MKLLRNIITPHGLIILFSVVGALTMLAAAFYLVGVVWWDYSFKQCLTAFLQVSFVAAVFVGVSVNAEMKGLYHDGWRDGKASSLDDS